MSFGNIFIVGMGGFLGSVSRYVVVKLVDDKLNQLFPFGTLTVNVVGSLMVGFIYALIIKKSGAMDDGGLQWKLLLGTGFCGGFTTFSAFAWENVSLMEQKMMMTSLLYIAISLVSGFAAVVAGAWLGRIF